MYNLAADPNQLRDLVETADEELLDRLADRLAMLEACAGESCRLPPPDPEAEEAQDAEAEPSADPEDATSAPPELAEGASEAGAELDETGETKKPER